MKIETKFNIDDEVFYLSPLAGKVVQSKVISIKIEVTNASNTIITYTCNSSETEKQIGMKVEENRAFKSKEALLKSL